MPIETFTYYVHPYQANKWKYDKVNTVVTGSTHVDDDCYETDM